MKAGHTAMIVILLLGALGMILTSERLRHAEDVTLPIMVAGGVAD